MSLLKDPIRGDFFLQSTVSPGNNLIFTSCCKTVPPPILSGFLISLATRGAKPPQKGKAWSWKLTLRVQLSASFILGVDVLLLPTLDP